MPKSVDHLIVGGGLIGLHLLKSLQQKHPEQKIILIEKSGELGGTLFSPDTPHLNAVLWGQGKNPKLFKYQSPQETFTLGKKGLIPFVGFGEDKVPTLEVINDFTSETTHLICDLQKPIFDINLESIALHTQITALNPTPTDVQELEVILNGKKNLTAKKIHWTPSFQELEGLLPTDEFGSLKQKSKKAKHFDAFSIQMERAHEELAPYQEHGKLILMGEEQTPWLGHITKSYLTFTSFFEHTQSSQHDFLRKHLKTLNRQLRKAFPALFDDEEAKDFSHEKIVLHKNARSTFKLPKVLIPGLHFLGSHKELPSASLEAKLDTFLMTSTSPSPPAK